MHCLYIYVNVSACIRICVIVFVRESEEVKKRFADGKLRGKRK